MRVTMLTAAVLACSVVRGVAGQTGTNQTLTNPTPSDARMNQFEDPKGASWRVFGLDSFADGPLAIAEVQEVRQQNPPSTWGVYVYNRSLRPVESYRIAAAIVSGDGNVKAIQSLPAIKNLGPAKVSRQEMRVIVTVLMPTDRVVFFVSEVVGEAVTWKAEKLEISAQVRQAAKRFPVP